MSLTRRALLVSAPGAEADGSLLPGVTADIKGYIDFLSSLGGGAWDAHELRVLENPSSNVLRAFIAATSRFDYTFLAFSGHGYESQDGIVHLNLRERDTIALSELLTEAPRQLILVDACRTRVREPVSVFLEKAEAVALDASMQAQREAARRRFEAALNNAEMGVIQGFSCKSNESAGENASGGYFTSSLLRAAAKWTEAADAEVLLLDRAWQLAKAEMARLPTKQNPEFLPGRRARCFPFAVRPK